MKTFYLDARSEETAFVVDNYPWGFRLKTEVKFWIERTSKGERFCKMTKNPKTGKWCKPKKSTYSLVALLYHNEATGKTSYYGACRYKTEQFLEQLGDKLDDWQIEQLNKSIQESKAISEMFDFSVFKTKTVTFGMTKEA